MGTVIRLELELRVVDVVRGVVVVLLVVVVVPFDGAVDLRGSLEWSVRAARTDDRDPLEVSRCLTDCGRVFVTLVVSFSTDESKLI